LGALPKLEVMASDGFGSPLLNDRRYRFDEVKLVHLMDLGRPDSALTEMRQRYVRIGFGEPGDQAILSYDAVCLIAEAMRKAGPDRDAIREWLSHVGRGQAAFSGISGSIAFTAQGDRTPQYFLQHVNAIQR
ncbi:MAG: hypothetical protein ABI625_16665, partial [bacterium]